MLYQINQPLKNDTMKLTEDQSRLLELILEDVADDAFRCGSNLDTSELADLCEALGYDALSEDILYRIKEADIAYKDKEKLFRSDF